MADRTLRPPGEGDSALDTSEPTDRRDGERGQGLVEYGFILVLIALVVIILVITIGHQTNNLYSNIQNGLTVATHGGGGG